MGTRYWVEITCQECGAEETAWHAPTCGVKTFKCDCGNEIDLEDVTGISEEQASNRLVLEKIIDSFRVPQKYWRP